MLFKLNFNSELVFLHLTSRLENYSFSQSQIFALRVAYILERVVSPETGFVFLESILCKIPRKTRVIPREERHWPFELFSLSRKHIVLSDRFVLYHLFCHKTEARFTSFFFLLLLVPEGRSIVIFYISLYCYILLRIIAKFFYMNICICVLVLLLLYFLLFFILYYNLYYLLYYFILYSSINFLCYTFFLFLYYNFFFCLFFYSFIVFTSHYIKRLFSVDKNNIK